MKGHFLDPGNWEIRFRLIGLDVKQGRYEKSRQARLAGLTGHTIVLEEKLTAYHQAQRSITNPIQAEIMYGLRLQWISQGGHPGEALRRADEVVANLAEPYDKLLGLARAWALADLDRLAEARVAAEKAGQVVDQFKFETIRSLLTLVGCRFRFPAGIAS